MLQMALLQAEEKVFLSARYLADAKGDSTADWTQQTMASELVDYSA